MKMLRPLFTLVVFLSLVTGAYADSHSIPTSVTFIATDFPPYDIANGSDGHQGFDVDVVKAAFKRVSIAAEVDFLPWKRGYNMAVKGLVAGAITCGKNPEREKLFYYPETLSYSTMAFFVQKDYQGPDLTTVAAAKGLKLGGVINYATNKFLESEGIPYKTYRTDRLLLRDLAAGIIDGFLTTRETADYLAQQMGISDKLKSYKVKDRPYYLCISKQHPNGEKLFELFNKGFMLLKQDGHYQKIHDNYR